MTPLHVKSFNDKVKLMNQKNAKDLTLTAQEARNLHSEIYSLLAQITELSQKKEPDTVSTNVNMDGGGF